MKTERRTTEKDNIKNTKDSAMENTEPKQFTEFFLKKYGLSFR